MASRQIIDMDDVQGGIRDGGHLAVEVVEHDLAGRRGADVTGPDRGGRQDEADVQPFRAGPEHLVLGDVLGPLVGPEQMGDVGIARLVGRHPGPCLPEPEHGHAGGVNQPLAPRGPDRAEHVERPADVDVVEDARITRPEPVERRQVEHEARAVAGRPDGGGVPDVRGDTLSLDGIEVAAVGARFDHGDHVRAPRPRLPCDRRPDEPRGAGNHHPVPGRHRARVIS